MKLKRLLPLISVFLVPLATAGEMTEGFARALNADPAFRAARAELEINRLDAKRAGRAYWPELGFKYDASSETGVGQRTIQLAQPLVNADRLATYMGSDPLAIRAEATMRQRESELASRYLAAIAELVRAREGLALNQRKLEAFGLQSEAAKRSFQLGTGTITDQRDTQVRLHQARAEELGLKARLAAAERQFLVITGEPAKADAFTLVRKKKRLVLPEVFKLQDLVQQHNPALILARQSERLADLDVWRKRGAFLPQLNAVAKQTKFENGTSNSYVGVAIDFPIQSGSILSVDSAKANAQKTIEDARAVDQKVQLEVERLHALVETGQVESDLRADAIEAAKLSVEGNEQSFRGGVRSQLDVLNAIQVLFEVQEEYVDSRLNLATNLVALHSQVGSTSVTEILKLVEDLLF